MCEFPAWLCDWPGPIIFLAAIVILPLVGLCLDAWDRWRYRRMFGDKPGYRRMPFWRRIRGYISWSDRW
jgi:hypothetical protein